MAVNSLESLPLLPTPEESLHALRHPDTITGTEFMPRPELVRLITYTYESFFSSITMLPTNLKFCDYVYGQCLSLARTLDCSAVMVGSTAKGEKCRDIDIQLIPQTDSPPLCLNALKSAYEIYPTIDNSNHYPDVTYFSMPHDPDFGAAALILRCRHETAVENPRIYSMGIVPLQRQRRSSEPLTTRDPATNPLLIEFGFPLRTNDNQLIPIPAIDPEQSSCIVLSETGGQKIYTDQLEKSPPEWIMDNYLLQLIMSVRGLKNINHPPFLPQTPPLTEYGSGKNHALEAVLYPGLRKLDGFPRKNTRNTLATLFMAEETRTNYIGHMLPIAVLAFNFLRAEDLLKLEEHNHLLIPAISVGLHSYLDKNNYEDEKGGMLGTSVSRVAQIFRDAELNLGTNPQASQENFLHWLRGEATSPR